MKKFKFLLFCVLYLSILGCQSCKKDPPQPDPKPTVYCNVTVLPASGVTVDPIFPNGSTKVEYGKPISITFNSDPSIKYRVLSSGVEVVSLRSGSCNYQVPSVISDLNLQIVSEATTFTVTATAGIGGTATPIGPTTVEYGKDLPLNIVENAEYTLTSIKVNGASVAIVKPYILKNITANSDVQIGFTLTQILILTNGSSDKSRPWMWTHWDMYDENHVWEASVNLNQFYLTSKTYYYINGKAESFNAAGVSGGLGDWSMLPGNVFTSGSQTYTIVELTDKKFVFDQKGEFTLGKIEYMRITNERQ